jgi:hypothetical protein
MSATVSSIGIMEGMMIIRTIRSTENIMMIEEGMKNQPVLL